MKILKGLLSLVLLMVMLMTVSCGDTTIDINGSMEISVYKTSITINTTFEDSESGLIAADSVKCYIVVYDDEEVEVSRKNVVIDVETMTGEKVEFNSLEADTEYSCKLVASKSGAQKTLETKSIKTINNGESAEDPILISTIDELKSMNKDSESYYELKNDIDCENIDLSAIFSSSNPFKGQLDGKGYKISNVKLDTSSTYTGIFGYAKNAEFKNLTISNVSFAATRGERYIGALVGMAENTVIDNVTVEGIKVEYTGQTSKTAMIGGLVGWAKGSDIKDCSVTALEFIMPKARLKVYTGGLVGQNENSSINNCYVEGSMDIKVGYTSNSNGLAYIGGFIGLNESSKKITNCYAKVDIIVAEVDTYVGNKSHTTCVGGFIGANATTSIKMENIAVIADINVTNERGYNVYVAGLVGKLKYNSNLKNCIYAAKESGITVNLMKAENGVVTNGKLAQEAVISLTVISVDDKAVVENVISYDELLSCNPVPAEDNQVTIKTCTISQDLTNFDEFIANLFNA